MRHWLALLAALVLAACDSAGPRPALLDSRSPPGLAPRFLAPQGWAWGAIQAPGEPELRYGVTAPSGSARLAHVLILPDTDEPAEVWFETAADLSRAGYVVWTLEWESFGGSGRRLPPYDMIHSDTAMAGPLAITALITQVIGPTPGRPLVLMASGDSAAAALTALELGAPADAVIFSAPDRVSAQSLKPWEHVAVRVGLARLPSPDWRPWSRAASALQRPAGADAWRGQLIHNWRLANPDLRQSGVSLGWRAVQGEARRSQGPQGPAARLVLTDRVQSVAVIADCQDEQGCRRVLQPGLGSAPHLAADDVRQAWLGEVIAFLDQQVPSPGGAGAPPIE